MSNKLDNSSKKGNDQISLDPAVHVFMYDVSLLGLKVYAATVADNRKNRGKLDFSASTYLGNNETHLDAAMRALKNEIDVVPNPTSLVPVLIMKPPTYMSHAALFALPITESTIPKSVLRQTKKVELISFDELKVRCKTFGVKNDLKTLVNLFTSDGFRSLMLKSAVDYSSLPLFSTRPVMALTNNEISIGRKENVVEAEELTLNEQDTPLIRNVPAKKQAVLIMPKMSVLPKLALVPNIVEDTPEWIGFIRSVLNITEISNINPSIDLLITRVRQNFENLRNSLLNVKEQVEINRLAIIEEAIENVVDIPPQLGIAESTFIALEVTVPKPGKYRMNVSCSLRRTNLGLYTTGSLAIRRTGGLGLPLRAGTLFAESVVDTLQRSVGPSNFYVVESVTFDVQLDFQEAGTLNFAVENATDQLGTSAWDFLGLQVY
jgi:hypothetical protein